MRFIGGSLMAAWIFFGNFVQIAPMIVDTHAHIYVEEFNDDRLPMLQRAEQEGVGRILMPAIDSSTHQAMLKLETIQSPVCQAMMGVHPCSIKQNFEEELALARRHLEKRPFVAVGEIGLDFYWDLTYTEQQYQAFRTQIEWALEYNIPIAIHSRSATDECIKVVAEYEQKGLRGVFHCFSGTVTQARQIMDLGFYLGIGGVLTFKNAGLDKVMEQTGLEQVVLETDAPYLAPMPFRGKRNEPSYLPYIVAKLAAIRHLSQDEVMAITTANAQKLFGF